MEYDYNFVGPAPAGYEDFLPIRLEEAKVPGRREEDLARSNAIPVRSLKVTNRKAVLAGSDTTSPGLALRASPSG